MIFHKSLLFLGEDNGVAKVYVPVPKGSFDSLIPTNSVLTEPYWLYSLRNYHSGHAGTFTVKFPNGSSFSYNASMTPQIYNIILPAGSQITQSWGNAYGCPCEFVEIADAPIADLGGGVILQRYLMPLISKITRWRHVEQRDSALEARHHRHDLRDHGRWVWRERKRIWILRKFWQLSKAFSKMSRFERAPNLLYRKPSWKQTLAYLFQSAWNLYALRYRTLNYYYRRLQLFRPLRLFSWDRGRQKDQGQIRASLSEQNAAFVMEAA